MFLGAYIFVVEAPFSDEDSICYTSGSKSRSETKYTTLDKEVPESYKAVPFISGLQTGNFATNPRLWVDNAKVSGDRVKVDFNTKSPTCVQFAQATVLLVDPRKSILYRCFVDMQGIHQLGNYPKEGMPYDLPQATSFTYLNPPFSRNLCYCQS